MTELSYYSDACSTGTCAIVIDRRLEPRYLQAGFHRTSPPSMKSTTRMTVSDRTPINWLVWLAADMVDPVKREYKRKTPMASALGKDDNMIGAYSAVEKDPIVKGWLSYST